MIQSQEEVYHQNQKATGTPRRVHLVEGTVLEVGSRLNQAWRS